MIDFIAQPWHWAFSGFMLVAGKRFDYFNYEWRKHDWLLMFVLGTIIGGAIAATVFASPTPVQISSATIADLAALGIHTPTTISEGAGFLPTDIFSFQNLTNPTGFVMMILGGFLVGFGTRWAGGCTSGHAISGLSELQLPSLVAVIGFFIGGLTTTFVIFPILF